MQSRGQKPCLFEAEAGNPSADEGGEEARDGRVIVHSVRKAEQHCKPWFLAVAAISRPINGGGSSI